MRWKLPVLMVCAALLWSGTAWAETPESSQELNAVKALSVEEGEDGTYIRLEGTEVATFSVFKLEEPPRLFVDISNSELAQGELSEDVFNGVISQVGVADYEDGFQSSARLMVGFEEPAHYDVTTEGDDVVVFIDGADRQQEAPAAVVERNEEAEQELESLRAQLASSEEALAQAQQDQEELDELRKELAQAHEDYRAEVQARESELSEAQQQLEATEARYQAEVEERRQARDEASDELAAMESRLTETESELEDLRQARDEATGEERQRLEESIAARSADLEQTEDQLAAQQREVEELQGAMASLEEERDAHRQEYEAAQQRADEASDQAEQAQARAKDAERQAEEARQQVSQVEAREAAARSEVASLESQLQEQRQQLEEAQARAELLESQLEEAREDGEAEDRIAELEAQSQQAQSDRASLEEQLQARDEELAELRASQEDSAESGQAMEAVPVDPAEHNAVRGVRIETTGDGYSQIVVDLERADAFETRRMREDGRSVMILNDVTLPSELEQTLSADSEGGAVRFLSSYEADDGTVRMEADLEGEASERLHQDGDQVVWEFAPQVAQASGSVEQTPREVAEQAQGQEERPREGESVTSSPPGYGQVVTNPAEVQSVPGMGTRPITIDLRAADISNVLRLISSESGVNIIAGDDVDGEVTMRLQGVPMDEAFLTILQSLSLGYEVRGNVIRVAPQSVLLEEEEARAEARARAQEVEPLEVFLLPINYASASDLTQQVDGLLSPRGSVSVDQRTNTLILKDLPQNLESIRMLIETLDAQVPQVLIEARIVETNENFDREFGIQWGGDFARSQGSGNPTGLIFPNVLGVSGGATDTDAPVEGTSENPNYAVNLPATAGTGSGGALGLTMGSVGGSVNLNLRLSAAEDRGYAQIISSPRILTLDNQEATISQGTSIPISVVSAAGVQTIFVDATLELTVTPHVTPDGYVRMSIEATKNEPDFQNTGARGDPTIIQNQAETELLVKDGDTTVIGGIYTENTGRSVNAVPFLHRIPIIGFLFRNHSQTENRSELLIFITPRIVNRAEALGVMSTGTIDGGMPQTD